MTLPVVAIVGRPNVGKSSLFNWLAGRRIAIVDPTAGVTRDRVSTLVPLGEGARSRFVELVDTGGMGVTDCDNLTEEIERQIALAIDRAHVVLFVVDGRDGVVPLDEEVAQRLRGLDKPILCLANKCDAPELDHEAAEFHKLGHGPVLCVSAQQNRNRQEVHQLILEQLPSPEELEDETPQDVVMKLAIVGRRNVGKSTFINALAREPRMIVSEVPGTTRDSVDVRFERDNQTFVAIDTAGVRRKGSIANDIEFYGMARAERSIRRADVVLLFLDASQPISKVDKQLAEYILQHHKPAIFVANKWDLMRPMPTSRLGDYIRATFPSLDYLPIAFVTAQTGKNAQTVLNLAQNLYKQAGARVSTGEINRLIRQALAAQSPPTRFNRRPKIYYATQAGTHPPTIVLFTNGPELIDNTYQRYLIKYLRDHSPFTDIPIRLHLRDKHRDEGSPQDVEEAIHQVPVAAEEPSRKPTRRKDVVQEPELWKDL